MEPVDLSVVISVYNEEQTIEVCYNELKKELGSLNISYKIIFVNDGSTDASFSILQNIAKEDKGIKVLNFSRNFGHESAMLAGLDHANSDAVICMDCDLQHPPACLKEMYNKFRAGADIIHMVRAQRKDGTALINLFSKLFYLIINKMTRIKIEPNASDFFLISKRVVAILTKDYRERTRFLRGLIQLIGFKREKIEFVAPKRMAGESKYSFSQLLVLSFSAISVLSKAPLRLGIYVGALFGLFSLGVGVYSLLMYFIDQPISGYTTIVILISAMFSILFFVLGIMADYIGNLFDEVKARPHYIVMDEIN